MAPVTIDGTSISGVTIDGTDVQEITIDGTSVWTAGIPDSDKLYARYDSSQSDWSSFPVTDLSGNSRPFESGTIYGGTDTKNGLQVMYFAEQTYYHAPNFDLSPPFTIYLMCQVGTNAASADYIYTMDFDTADELGLRGKWASDLQLFGDDTDLVSYDPHTYYVFTVKVDGNGNAELYKNGSLGASISNVGSPTATEFVLGARANNFRPMGGYAGEVAIYPDVSQHSQSDVETFLMDKWGLP